VVFDPSTLALLLVRIEAVRSHRQALNTNEAARSLAAWTPPVARLASRPKKMECMSTKTAQTSQSRSMQNRLTPLNVEP